MDEFCDAARANELSENVRMLEAEPSSQPAALEPNIPALR